jgi:hypothetical protein
VHPSPAPRRPGARGPIGRAAGGLAREPALPSSCSSRTRRGPETTVPPSRPCESGFCRRRTSSTCSLPNGQHQATCRNRPPGERARTAPVPFPALPVHKRAHGDATCISVLVLTAGGGPHGNAAGVGARPDRPPLAVGGATCRRHPSRPPNSSRITAFDGAAARDSPLIPRDTNEHVGIARGRAGRSRPAASCDPPCPQARRADERAAAEMNSTSTLLP